MDTPKTRNAECKLCGRVVTETLHYGFDGAWWDAEKHDAPCGWVCLGGGLSHKEAKARRYHGGMGRCECKETP